MVQNKKDGRGRGESPDPFITYEIEPMRCPACDDLIEMASTTADLNDSKTPPVVGDITLCFNCGEILVIDPEEKSHTPEVLEMMEWPQDLRLTVLTMQGEIKRRGRIRNKE